MILVRARLSVLSDLNHGQAEVELYMSATKFRDQIRLDGNDDHNLPSLFFVVLYSEFHSSYATMATKELASFL